MIGTVVSHYKILEKLGEGGMGVVYKAEDSTLDRLVALKFLPQHLNASPEDKLRFIQEAKAASAINHPNICTVYAIEELKDQLFIAMEFVDGQTLREKRGSISFKQAVDIGIQMADGLACAHEKGIVHRDIKPENIMIRRDGIAQIMDFGLAKLRTASSKINRLTKEGSTVGTAGYMSPEQIQGQDVDHRSDIFSLGVVLYELFTGQLPFKGVHETALAYEIVNVDAAPMSAIKPEIDASLDAIVLECLAKEPAERYQSVAEVAKELRRFKRESNRSRVSRVTAVRDVRTGTQETAQGAAPAILRSAPASPELRPSSRLWMMVSALLLLALAASLILWWRATTREAHTVRFIVTPPANGSFVAGEAPMISPDGFTVAFVAQDSGGKTSLWIRPLSTTVATLLEGTGGASYPFWSPDNRFIGFFQMSKLRKIAVTGGPVQTIADAPDGRGGTWSEAGVIVFAPNSSGGLQRVSDAGGTPADITTLDTSRFEETHRWPWFLPDGRRFLYVRRSGDNEKTAVYLGSADGKDNSYLLPIKSSAVYADPGYLLFIEEHSLMAQPFDGGKGAVSGQAFPIAEDVGLDLNRSTGLFSSSRNGVLALGFSGNSAAINQLTWFDRSGKMLQKVGSAGPHFDFALSPDEKRVAFRQADPGSGNHDLWILDILRGTESRFTFSVSREDDPAWSPDGSKIYFDSNIDGVTGLFQKASSGVGNQENVFRSSTASQMSDCSPDGRYLLYTVIDNRSKNDLWILPLTGDRKPYPYVRSEASEDVGHFSPDGKWIAYNSSESGRDEVYVQSFPLTEGKWQVSTGGGRNPMWSKDGKELFYISPEKKLMAVEVRPGGAGFDLGIPRPLFQTGIDDYTSWNTYAPSRDGKRFLINTVVGGALSRPIQISMNWTAGIGRK